MFEVGEEVWVIGGLPISTARAADILSGPDFVTSAPLFASPFGANYFWKQNGGVVEIRGWKGGQQTMGEVYRSDQSAVSATFDQATTFHNGKVLEVGDQVLLWGAEDDAYQCNRVARLPKTGDLAGGAIFTLEHTVCQPAMVLLDADTALIAGGYANSGPVRAVKHYQFASNLISQPMTPDGRVVELVHARNRPQVVRRPDGVVIIVGGYGDPELTPRYEVLVPSP